MAEYSYRGFNISYEVGSADNNLYKADGKVVKLDKQVIGIQKKFHTEHPTASGAKKAIKKLIEDYVDFEWKEYYEMH